MSSRVQILVPETTLAVLQTECLLSNLSVSGLCRKIIADWIEARQKAHDRLPADSVERRERISALREWLTKFTVPQPCLTDRKHHRLAALRAPCCRITALDRLPRANGTYGDPVDVVVELFAEAGMLPLKHHGVWRRQCRVRGCVEPDHFVWRPR